MGPFETEESPDYGLVRVKAVNAFSWGMYLKRFLHLMMSIDPDDLNRTFSLVFNTVAR